MFHLLKVYIKDRWVLAPLFLSALAQCFIWYYLVAVAKHTSDQYFLHYNIIFGVDLVGSWGKIFLLPIGGLVIVLFNSIISILIFNQDKLLARLLGLFASVFQIFLAWAVYLIVEINL